MSRHKYDINTLPALELKQRLSKKHSLRNVSVWTTVTRLTDSVTLLKIPEFEFGLQADRNVALKGFFFVYFIFIVSTRDTEYKGMQLSLDQMSPTKPAFPYADNHSEDRKSTKSRLTPAKTKVRASPYPQVTNYIRPLYEMHPNQQD